MSNQPLVTAPIVGPHVVLDNHYSFLMVRIRDEIQTADKGTTTYVHGIVNVRTM